MNPEPTPIDGVSAIALVLIVSFAIDRVVNGILFLLSFSQRWEKRCPEPTLITDPAAHLKAVKRCKLVYFLLAGFFGMIVLAGLGQVRILTAMGIRPAPAVAVDTAPVVKPPPTPAGTSPAPSPAAVTPGISISSWLFTLLDIVFIGLLLMGGADTVARALKLLGAPGAEKSAPQPIEITGRLTLDERRPDRSK